MPGTSASGSRRIARRACYVAALPLALLVSGLAASEPPEWRDIESRIQYGYYTEDAAALRKLAEPIAAADSGEKLRGYYAGLLNWRLALLALPAGSGTQFAHRCVDELDSALAIEADFAEALALRAACLAQPLSGGGLHLPLAAHGMHRDIKRSRELAPRNPRVLLIDGMGEYQLPSSLGGNKDHALATLRQSVAAFEAERAATEKLPGWGAAEAYLLLGRDLLDHGDTLGARDALEHALLIAPEFLQARRLMAKITSG